MRRIIDSPRSLCLFALLLAAVLPLSCSFLPEREEPLEPEVPGQFSEEGGAGDFSVDWWKDFGSPELDRLMEGAFAGNFDLRRIEARLRQARADAVIAGAGLYPELDLNAAGGAIRARSGSSGNRTTATTENYSLGLAASYEIDLWGRVRSTASQAGALVSASAGDLDAARISLAGEVTERWLRAVELHSRLELVGHQLETNRTYLRLLLLRQRKGLATALAVFQQEQIVSGTESLVPLLEAELSVTRYELAVLLGRPPRANLELAADSLPELTPLPRIGLPAMLLENRPDIRAAFFRLESADWAVSAARANRLPALTLTGSASYRSDDFNELFNSWFAGFAAGLLAPLIDGGRRSAEADRALAVSDEWLASYRETVLNAFREVEDALVRERKQGEYIGSLGRELTAARNALAEALLRYRKGDSEYLDVLASLTSVQTLEREMLAAQRDLVLYRVGLYRALGGGWEEEGENKDEFQMTNDEKMTKSE
ncbi:MAG: efflux transporter outer membrane subunit [PVC group bacterium]